MRELENFRKIRADGIVLPEFERDEIFAKARLTPRGVMRIEWEWYGETISLQHENPIFCRVLPDRTGIVAILTTNLAKDQVLAFINADGTPRFSCGSLQVLGETRVSVSYEWIEDARTDPNRDIGVVCDAEWLSGPPLAARPGLFEHLDIDPDDGRIVGHSKTM